MRIFVLFAIAGCGSSSDVTGDAAPGTFHIVDTVSASITMSDGAGGSSSAARIVLASTSSLCADAGATTPIDRKGQHFIAIELRDVTGSASTAPAAPAPYTIYPNTGSQPPKSASFVSGSLDGNCQSSDVDAASGQSGTVTLTSVTGGVFAGSYDVTLNTGGHVTGTFQPTACPALQAAANNDTHSCL